ncbi:hypothetical protein GMA11_06595 [Granulicatella sp. zg-ZJ]|uniref:sensor histidine kinase n=1 Tax=Granulicatella sp. zg-ZJ TaxID=2678504 RepID=UPI0013D4410D|nr:HAMP domain-containing sensor histidine kinase [Granulicatella sp. zg-ZJ]NEW63062.1 hypothetical protein [Granulicatella sp. zg-ZJ]
MKVYHNHEARKWLYGYFVLSACILLLLLGLGIYWQQLYRTQLQTIATEIFAISQTNGSFRDYFNGAPLSQDALKEVGNLQNHLFAPKNMSFAPETIFIYLFIIWFILSALIFVCMTLYLNSLYKEIGQLKEYVSHFVNSETVYDIRSNKEGTLSALKNELYQTATALHFQFKTAKKHKDYLSKNIADISHQLKTPLTSLLVVTDTLLALPVEERSDEQLELLEPQLDRINVLIQSLLLLTRLDAGVIKLKKETIDTKEFINSILSQLDVLITNKHLDLHVSYPDGATLYADTFYITEAVSNVIKNAIDYTPMYKQLRISIEDTVFFSTIYIFNEGSHIDKEDLPYIFERFYRGKKAVSSSVGIGLSLAYEIIQQHNGKLSAENTADGVLFTCSIPKP